MGQKTSFFLAVWAILTLAPWAVYLAGVAKLTDVFNGATGATWLRQQIYMLEWYEIWAQLAIVIAFIIIGFAQMSHIGGFLQMWTATNTALIIYSATLRLVAINAVDDDGTFGIYDRSNLDGLRCTAAGQITTAFCNFILVILLSLAPSNTEAAPKKEKEPAPTVAAAQDAAAPAAAV